MSNIQSLPGSELSGDTSESAYKIVTGVEKYCLDVSVTENEAKGDTNALINYASDNLKLVVVSFIAFVF